MDQEKIGKFIAECRKKKKMTQEELAAKLGVNNRSISRWENGQYMPDISIYNDLCKELDITINEFLSGEKLNKEEYQEKFEENIIEVVKQTDNKNKYYNCLCSGILIFIAFVIIYLLVMNFIFNFKLEQKFDKEIFNVTGNKETINFKHQEEGDIKYLITESDNKGIIFITFYQTIAEKISSSNSYLDITEYDLTRAHYYENEINLSRSNIPENYQVYYTNTSFSKIAKSDSKELDTIIKKSYLLYDSEKD